MASSQNISEWIEVFSDVLQGSVIDPLSFVVFINDLLRSLPHSCQRKLFAYDTEMLILYFIFGILMSNYIETHSKRQFFINKKISKKIWTLKKSKISEAIKCN